MPLTGYFYLHPECDRCGHDANEIELRLDSPGVTIDTSELRTRLFGSGWSLRDEQLLCEDCQTTKEST